MPGDVSLPVHKLTPAQGGLHRNFAAAMKALRRDLVRAAYYLLQVRERNIHRALGFSTIAEYGAAVGGLTPRQCRDFLLVAKRLPHSPGIQDALESGSITWSQARHICTEPTSGTEADLTRAIDSLNGRSTDESHVAACVSPAAQDPVRPKGAERSDSTASAPVPTTQCGEQPYRKPAIPSNPATDAVPPQRPRADDDAAPMAAQHVVSLSFTPDQYARWQAAASAARRRGDLKEQLLAGLAAPNGGASVAEILLVRLLCPQCGQATQPTTRGELALTPTLLAAARCDAIIEDENVIRRRSIAPRIRRTVMRRARYRCENGNCGQAAFLTIHHRTPHAGGGADDPTNLIVLCWRCHHAIHEAEDSARAALRGAP